MLLCIRKSTPTFTTLGKNRIPFNQYAQEPEQKFMGTQKGPKKIPNRGRFASRNSNLSKDLEKKRETI